MKHKEFNFPIVNYRNTQWKVLMTLLYNRSYVLRYGYKIVLNIINVLFHSVQALVMHSSVKMSGTASH